jgi:hypothetical protein
MRHIYEHGDVMLGVEYTPGHDVPTFHDIRVLGADYQPVGPNLVHLLDESYIKLSDDTAQHFLTRIVEEIHAIPG